MKGSKKAKDSIEQEVESMLSYWTNLFGLGRWEINVKIMPLDLMPLSANESLCYGKTEINEELMSMNIKILEPGDAHIFEETLLHELLHVVLLQIEKQPPPTDQDQCTIVTENVIELLSRAFIDARNGVYNDRIICQWLKHGKG